MAHDFYGPLTPEQQKKADAHNAEIKKLGNDTLLSIQNQKALHKGGKEIFPPAQYPSNLQKKEFGLEDWMSFSALNVIAVEHGNTKKKNSVWDCALPMPTQLSFPQGHSYNNTALGPAGGIMKEGIAELANSGDLKKVMDTATDAWTTNFITKLRSVGTTLGGAMTGTNIEAGLQLETKTKINPNMEVIYEGTPFRTFAFNWEFVPHNEKDQIELKRIITLFKFYAAPEFPDDKTQLWLNFPNTWKISFRTGNGINTWLPQMDESVLTNIQVDYNAQTGGWATRKSSSPGAPIATNLVLTFTETVIQSKTRKYSDLGGVQQAQEATDAWTNDFLNRSRDVAASLREGLRGGR